MSVTVYTIPNCPGCDQTKKYLDRKDVAYDVVDITVDEEARDLVFGLGFKAAPVVIAGEDAWSGFRPDRLNKLFA